MQKSSLVYAVLLVACGSPPKTNAKTAVARSTVDDPGRAAAKCVEPKMEPAKAREDGINAYLEGRISEALHLLETASREAPRDRAADAFRRATLVKVDARRVRAEEELKMIAPVVLEAAPGARSSKRSIPNVTGAKIRLVKESEKKNLITDNADWEKRIQAPSPRVDVMRAETVAAMASERPRGVFRHPDHVVTLYSRRIAVSADGRRTIVFDTSNVNYEINFAQLVGGTLLVQAAQRGPAVPSGGKDGFVIAYDGGSGDVVWSSDPIVGNAGEMAVTGGSIVTGYGFTNEPDFVYVLDLATGATEQKLPVKTAPEAIRPKGDRVHVRTYDVDYVFKSAAPSAPAPPASLPVYADAGIQIEPETRCFVRQATSALEKRDRAGLLAAIDGLTPRSKDRLLLEALSAEEKSFADDRRLDLLAAPLLSLPAPSWDAPPPAASNARDPKLVKVRSAKAPPGRTPRPTYSTTEPWFIAPIEAGALPPGARTDIPRSYGLEDLRAILPSAGKTLLVYGGRFVAVVRGDTAERVFDFETYRHPPKVNPQYKEFAEEDVTYAQEADGALYVCNGGGSYAREVYGKKGFLSAIEVASGRVLWRSPPLTCNATFAIVGSHIVSGYGFTEEPDFVFLVRRTDGAIVQRIPVDIAPTTITAEGNKVHVETHGNPVDLELR